MILVRYFFLCNSPTFQPFGDEIHGRRSDIFSKETFVSTKLALTYDVVEGGQGLGGGSVHVGRYKMHKPVIGPLSPLPLLSDSMKRKTKTLSQLTS